MFKFFDLIKERDEYGFLVCVLVVRGGNLKVFKLFYEIFNLFFINEDKKNMYDVVKLLNNEEIIRFIGDSY